MEVAALTAMTGLAGSLVGAFSSMTTTWIAHRGQRMTQWREREVGQREALYDEFIAEAARCLGDAMTRDPEGPETLVALFALVSRMRLRSSRPVIQAAEDLMGVIVDTYASPNLTFVDIQKKFRERRDPDPMAKFGEACRDELRGLRL